MVKTSGKQVEAKLEAGIKDRAPGRHGFGDRLWLEVGAGRAWSFRYMVNGRARSMGLGAWPQVSLPMAREKVAAALALIEAGKDPIDERRKVKAGQDLVQARRITLDAAAEAYITGNAAKWRSPKSAPQWRASLKAYVSPVIGSLPIADVGTDHVLRILQPIWTTKPETAVRVRGRLETVIAAAIAQGWATEPKPARWHNHLQMVLPPRSKVAPVVPHAALDWHDLPAFAARSGEARGATWSEVDLDGATWRIPAQRMKANRPHVLPLSAPALAVLRKAEALRGTSDFVFQGMKPDRPLSDMSLLAVLNRLGRSDITVHGMRAAFKTWASDATDTPREIIEASLAHVVGDRAEQAYQRGTWLERRRRLMDVWGAFCGQPPDDVVAFRRAG